MNMPSAEATRLNRWITRAAIRLMAAIAVAVIVLAMPTPARASLLSAEAEDKVAWGITFFILFVVPVVLIAAFWLVHILPEQIAHRRGHPQFEAIRTVCLLSLVFGGMLWPIAWIWAYSKPVLHKIAYGHDKLHPDEPYPGEPAVKPASLRDRLARLEAAGVAASELQPLVSDIEALEAKLTAGGAR